MQADSVHLQLDDKSESQDTATMAWESVIGTILSILYLILYPLVYALWRILKLLQLLVTLFMSLSLNVLHLSLWPFRFLVRFEVRQCYQASRYAEYSHSIGNLHIPGNGHNYWRNFRLDHILHLHPHRGLSSWFCPRITTVSFAIKRAPRRERSPTGAWAER